MARGDTLAQCVHEELIDTNTASDVDEFREQTTNILFEGLGQITEPVEITYTVEKNARRLVFDFRVELKAEGKIDTTTEQTQDHLYSALPSNLTSMLQVLTQD